MKELALYKVIDGYDIVSAVVKATANPAETIKEIATVLNISPQQVTLHPSFDQLFEQYASYFPVKPGEKVLTSIEAANLKSNLARATDHEALTLTGELIPDQRGMEYHIKTAGAWARAQVDHIGDPLPDGAVLPDDLTAGQRAEIAAQAEAERIAALTLEQKDAEKQAALDAAADEAARLEKRAQIQGKDFDPAAYYAVHQAEIEAKYTA
jgi:hypothetical protein